MNSWKAANQNLSPTAMVDQLIRILIISGLYYLSNKIKALKLCSRLVKFWKTLYFQFQLLGHILKLNIFISIQYLVDLVCLINCTLNGVALEDHWKVQLVHSRYCGCASATLLWLELHWFQAMPDIVIYKALHSLSGLFWKVFPIATVHLVRNIVYVQSREQSHFMGVRRYVLSSLHSLETRCHLESAQPAFKKVLKTWLQHWVGHLEYPHCSAFRLNYLPHFDHWKCFNCLF